MGTACPLGRWTRFAEEGRRRMSTRSRRRNGSARSKLRERRGLRLDSTRGQNPSGWRQQCDESRAWRGPCGLRSASVTAIGPRAGRSATRAGKSLLTTVGVHQASLFDSGHSFRALPAKVYAHFTASSLRRLEPGIRPRSGNGWRRTPLSITGRVAATIPTRQ
jgi:hypothetical protein